MKKEYIITGKTLEDAKAKAYAQYGHEGEISITVLKEAKKGFLGIGGSDAEIKVVVSSEEQVSFDSILKDVKTMKSGNENKPQNAQTKPQNNQPKQQNNQPKNPQNAQAKPQVQEKAADDAKASEEAASELTAQPVKKSKHKHRRKKKNNNGQSVEKVQTMKDETQKTKKDEEPKVEVTEEEMASAVQFAELLISSMALGAKVVRETAEDGSLLPALNIVGDESGILIGHHGETLDAIQYLVNLSANRKAGDGKEFVKISVDVENYRAKREETLRALARRMADRCVKAKRNIVLEPMNPYERRIIHSEIQDIENVATHSVGYDENRKIVITYEGADKAPETANRHHRSHSQNRAEKERSREVNQKKNEEALEAFRQYTAEKVAQPKPEKMTFEDFLASDSADYPMSILSEKKNSDD